MSTIIVNKFGGGILKENYFSFIKERLKEQIEIGDKPIVVVSAFPGVTDYLINIINSLKENPKNNIKVTLENLKDKHLEILKSLSLKDIEEYFLNDTFLSLENDINSYSLSSKRETEDKIISYGERISAHIVALYLNQNGFFSKKFLAEDIPIISDNNFKDANIIFNESKQNISNLFTNMTEIPVVSGFTGITKDGKITTLGRGGTDTTACFIGGALEAKKVILWKDVGGVLSADPKIVKKPKPVPYINYTEAEESGKIIHEKAIQYIKSGKTELEICSIENPKLKTVITNEVSTKLGAKIISFKKDLNLIVITDEKIGVNNLLLKVTESFIKHKVDIILVSNTRYSLQILANDNNNELKHVYEEIKNQFEKVEMVKSDMVFMVGSFKASDVSKFNDLLVDLKTDLLISAFYYENCNRIEAVIKTSDFDNIIRKLYRKFIS